MGFLIDTCIFIQHERDNASLHDFLIKYNDESVAISVITAAELLHGIFRAKDSAIKIKRQAFVESILTQLPTLEFDLSTARIYAQIWAELAQKGKSIAAHDLQIGSTALNHGLTLITYNTKDFLRIPGLKMTKLQTE